MNTDVILGTGESTWEMPAIAWAVPPPSRATILYIFSWCPQDFGLLPDPHAARRGLIMRMPPMFDPRLMCRHQR